MLRCQGDQLRVKSLPPHGEDGVVCDEDVHDVCDVCDVLDVCDVSDVCDVYRVEESLPPHREDEGDVRQKLVILSVHLRPNTCEFSQDRGYNCQIPTLILLDLLEHFKEGTSDFGLLSSISGL